MVQNDLIQNLYLISLTEEGLINMKVITKQKKQIWKIVFYNSKNMVCL